MGYLICCCQPLYHFFFFFFLHFQALCSSSLSVPFSPNFTKRCLPKESSALLQFKTTFSIDCSIAYCSNPSIHSWEAGTDCCLWGGVTCDVSTGHVIGLDLSCNCLRGNFPPNNTLFLLSHLQSLNLASNDFNFSRIPSQFGLLTKLTHLNLSWSSFFGQIPPELAHLTHMVSLDLSSDYGYECYLAFEMSNFEKLSQNLTQLRDLNVNMVSLSSVTPMSLLNLSSSLRSLRLSQTDMHEILPNNFFRFPSLAVLDASGTNLKGNFPNPNFSSPMRTLNLSSSSLSGQLPNSIGNLKSLEYLDLGWNALSGIVPNSIGNLKSLKILDLSNNNFSGEIPNSIGNLKYLESLELYFNNFSGKLPDSIENLKSIKKLDLSFNNFCGKLPISMVNLSQISILRFSSNQLIGPLPHGIVALPSLTIFDASHNFLDGRMPSWLFTLPSLELLDLRNNFFTGPIDQFQPNSSLKYVSLKHNRIHGPIPSSIFELESLRVLDLSYNNLSGIVEWNMLQKLKELGALFLSHNVGLSSATSKIVNLNMSSLRSLDLSSCNISEFLKVFRSLENLQTLDLSNNRIHGRITKDEFKGWPSLWYVDLSNNFLTGLDQHPWNNVGVLDLSSNLLQGQLLVPPVSAQVYLISNNKLSGPIPSLLCNSIKLLVLDLSNNDFSGVIPQCLGNLSLSDLNLRNNNFHGSILGTFGESASLKVLDLSDNLLKGPLSPSLGNCSGLEVLNLGNNMINDTFPYMLETLPNLKILVLQSNNFHGAIGHPRTMSPFCRLQVLDLSHNKFTGLLPMKYLQNLEVLFDMDGVDSGSSYIMVWGIEYYVIWKWDRQKHLKPLFVHLKVTMKGLEIEMTKIQSIYTSIDCSDNHFHGEIPEAIGMLKSLRLLNLSHNSLTGRIPSSLGNMSALESLDLSSNKLLGQIPSQLTSLTFLAVLNLSNNQLTGPIPNSKQFGTFSNDSYQGNLGLCGVPLSKKCSSTESPHLLSTRFNTEEDGSAGWFDWKIAAMGYASGLVIGLSMGYIVFATGKPQWFVRMVKRKQNRIVRRSNARRRGRRN